MLELDCVDPTVMDESGCVAQWTVEEAPGRWEFFTWQTVPADFDCGP